MFSFHMGLKDFFKEKFGSKEIELPHQTEKKLAETVPEEKDTRATRRRLFESKMIKVFVLAVGINIMIVPRGRGDSEEIVVEQEAVSDTQILYQKLGPEFDNFLRQMQEYNIKKETKGEKQIEFEVGNFDEAETTNEEIKNLFLKTYPQNWLRRVKEVTLVPYELDVPAEYNIKTKAIAVADKRGELGGAQIVFSQNLRNVFGSMSHELGHANDWLNRTDLPQAYRIKLLHSVVERLDKGDRYHSAYVESIVNRDSRKQLMIRATEYWGEIVQFYFDKPQEAKTRLSPYDLDLIEKFLQKVAPDFNLETAALERQVRQKLVIQGVMEHRFKKQAVKMKLADIETFLDQIKQYSQELMLVAKADNPLVSQAEHDNDQDVVLEQLFSAGDKKWIEINGVYLDKIGLLNGLANLYQKADLSEEFFLLIEHRVKELCDIQNKFIQKMKMFGKEEQKKILEFQKHLEKVVRKEKINPYAIDIKAYYESR